MVQLQRDYLPKGASLVAINSNDDEGYPEDSFENMITRSKEKGINFPYLRDETQEVARKYGAICTPHIFLFDQQRVVSYKGRIDDNRNPSDVKSHDLRNAIDAVLSGKTPATGPQVQGTHRRQSKPERCEESRLEKCDRRCPIGQDPGCPRDSTVRLLDKMEAVADLRISSSLVSERLNIPRNHY